MPLDLQKEKNDALVKLYLDAGHSASKERIFQEIILRLYSAEKYQSMKTTLDSFDNNNKDSLELNKRLTKYYQTDYEDLLTSTQAFASEIARNYEYEIEQLIEETIDEINETPAYQHIPKNLPGYHEYLNLPMISQIPDKRIFDQINDGKFHHHFSSNPPHGGRYYTPFGRMRDGYQLSLMSVAKMPELNNLKNKKSPLLIKVNDDNRIKYFVYGSPLSDMDKPRELTNLSQALKKIKFDTKTLHVSPSSQSSLYHAITPQNIATRAHLPLQEKNIFIPTIEAICTSKMLHELKPKRKNQKTDDLKWSEYRDRIVAAINVYRPSDINFVAENINDNPNILSIDDKNLTYEEIIEQDNSSLANNFKKVVNFILKAMKVDVKKLGEKYKFFNHHEGNTFIQNTKGIANKLNVDRKKK